MASVAEVRLAKHQMVADVGDIFTVAYHLEIPRAIFGIAVHHGTDQFLVLQHQLFIHTACGIVHQNFIRPIPAGEVPCRKQINTGDLELG